MTTSRSIRGPRAILCLAFVTAVVATGCQSVDSSPPVASVSVRPDPAWAIAAGPMTLDYRFVVSTPVPPGAPWQVLVHGLDAAGHVVWTDDHQPPVPAAAWRAGQTVQYSRTTFLPQVGYIGPLRIVVGLYRDGERLALINEAKTGAGELDRAYEVAKVDIHPQSAGLAVRFDEGWYDEEFGSDPRESWRWTASHATAIVEHPPGAMEIFLDWDQPAAAARGQQVRVLVNDQPLLTLTPASKNGRIERLPVPTDIVGRGARTVIRLDTTPAFVPAARSASDDMRALGIRVLQWHVQSVGSSPALARELVNRDLGALDVR